MASGVPLFVKIALFSKIRDLLSAKKQKHVSPIAIETLPPQSFFMLQYFYYRERMNERLEVTTMPNDFFMWFIMLWSLFIMVMMAIGGYFMFRKFFKKMPKEDGMSELDWQNHYIDQTRHLWGEEGKLFLEELVEPVPQLFRDVARDKIAGKIGELALEEKVDAITQDLIIKGYCLATPKRDHKFLIKKLSEKNIDQASYKQYLQV